MRSLYAAALASVSSVLAGQAGAVTTLYSFTDGTDGGFPHAGLIADAHGNLYGTTTSGGAGHNGTVYMLTKPGKGGTSWTETTLYAFTGGNDGSNPQASLAFDAHGNLYGTTYAGGAQGQGTVFEIEKPKKGGTSWTEKTLWTFTGGNDGGASTSSLVFDAAGNLYGTTEEGGTGVVGTVFELSPPAQGHGKWSETVLYNFTGNADGGEPYGRVLIGADGNLYGTTAGYGAGNYGTIFKLVHAGNAWNFALLHGFQGGTDGEVPRDGLIQGPDGTLYGTSAGFDNSYGNVYSLNTDGTGYTVIYTVAGGQGFTGNGPWQTIAMDTDGRIYGTTYGDGMSPYGEVFRLTPPKKSGGAWKASVLYAFPGGASGQFPYCTPLITKHGIIGTTYGTAGQAGFFPGTVWQTAK